MAVKNKNNKDSQKGQVTPKKKIFFKYVSEALLLRGLAFLGGSFFVPSKYRIARLLI
jgi:hypothetical protein